jgi:opacity protein-like surface antigen
MLVRFGFAVAVACFAVATSLTQAAEKTEQVAGTWSLIIPEAYEGIVFAWRLHADGTYEEDGWYRTTGQPVQTTLTGTWSVNGHDMILRQDTLGFVFEGTFTGTSYSGQLSQSGRRVSYFCALKGEAPPEKCEPTVAKLANKSGVL